MRSLKYEFNKEFIKLNEADLVEEFQVLKRQVRDQGKKLEFI